MDVGGWIGSPAMPEVSRRSDRAHILAVANKKGGTGKSTTVVNLAAEFAVRGHAVLVVDLDAQGHAGLGFGHVAPRGAKTAHDVLRHPNAVLADAVVTTTVANVDLLPADREFDGDVRVSDPCRLARALAPLTADYDVVLIDTPPSAPRLIVAALMTAEMVLIPTLLDHLSNDGVGQFLRAYHGVVSRHNSSLTEALIVPTRVDLRSSMQKAVLSSIASCHGRSRLSAGVRIDVSVAEAFGACCPLRQWRPSARAVADFAHLADDIQWRLAPAGRSPSRGHAERSH